MSAGLSTLAGLSASERLTQSRELLQQALQTLADPQSGVADQRVDGAATDWLSILKSIPGVGVVTDAVRSWWRQHPLYAAGVVLADTAKAVVLPLAQRHPLALVAGGFLVGGLLGWTRPWRWIVTPALLAGLLPQLLSKAAVAVPPSSWMTILATLLKQPEAMGQRQR
jgi:hypothetical protein